MGEPDRLGEYTVIDLLLAAIISSEIKLEEQKVESNLSWSYISRILLERFLIVNRNKSTSIAVTRIIEGAGWKLFLRFNSKSFFSFGKF